MILITGASHGIGSYLFERYTTLGIPVQGTCRSRKSEKLHQLDVSSFDAVNQWVKQLTANGINQVSLINCAAINYNSFAHKADPGRWESVIRTNLIGSFWMIKCLLPIMREQNFGRIINFSSVVAQKGICGTSAYAASKAALWGMTKAIAQENASKHITINSINLGYADIGMGKDEISDESKKVIISSLPSGRFCDPEEIFKTVQYIRDTEYINGVSIDLNGAYY
ncbi:MAG: SDR family NAD(P)-dependent oxidoreductase [Spirochaetales bacterium]